MTNDAELLAYLAAREEQRANRVQMTYATLTKREKALVTEAAVMGFFQGTQAAGGFNAKIPKNSVVTTVVIDACLAYPDLYPAMDRVARRAGVA